MPISCNSCQYLCGICKIICYTICCKCCSIKKQVKEEYAVLCLGLTGAGKSTLLATLCAEKTDDIQPTNGFSIKDITMSNTIFNIKEVGGSEKIRRYWPQYYAGNDGVIFVIDGLSDEHTLLCARQELKNALSDPRLMTLPLLVLVSRVENENTETVEKISMLLNLSEVGTSSYILDHYDLDDAGRLKMTFEKYGQFLNQQRILARLAASGESVEINRL